MLPYGCKIRLPLIVAKEVFLKIREPAVAGSFYPADHETLRREINRYLAEATLFPKIPKAIVAPHAGTKYSGPVAATAYASLKGVRSQIQQVVLLGPAHRVALRGMAASSATCFRTPLGDIPVDQKTVSAMVRLPGVKIADEPHREEHSLELHLPFLQEVLGQFQLVPLVVGLAEPKEVAAVVRYLWGGPKVLLVVSSDLSHYETYQTAQSLDQETAKHIESCEWKEIEDDRACGFFPLRGFLMEAREKHLQGKCLDLRNSGDTAGDKSRVVGYGAFHFYEST